MKLVVFDCDGTIVDSQNGIVRAMDYAFETAGLVPPSRAATLSIVGLSLPEAFAVLAPDAPLSSRLAMAERYKNAFAELRRDPRSDEPLFPGARDAIQTLIERDDVMLGIATGKSRRGVDRLFAREGWDGKFATIQTADEHPSKPHPSMLMTAIAETGIGPEATVMIGDTTYDVEMSLRAGVKALGVSWGYHAPQELDNAGAHALIERYSDLIPAVDRLLPAAGVAV